jgi:hypothetical protein
MSIEAHALNEALNRFAAFSAILVTVGIGAGFFVQHQSDKYRALAEAERDADRRRSDLKARWAARAHRHPLRHTRP